jgi:hypothetical protein
MTISWNPERENSRSKENGSQNSPQTRDLAKGRSGQTSCRDFRPNVLSRDTTVKSLSCRSAPMSRFPICGYLRNRSQRAFLRVPRTSSIPLWRLLPTRIPPKLSTNFRRRRPCRMRGPQSARTGAVAAVGPESPISVRSTRGRAIGDKALQPRRLSVREALRTIRDSTHPPRSVLRELRLRAVLR